MTENVEKPVAKNGPEKQPCTTLIRKSPKIKQRQQTTPNHTGQQAVAVRDLDRLKFECASRIDANLLKAADQEQTPEDVGQHCSEHQGTDG
jgi:hypothetical protein